MQKKHTVVTNFDVDMKMSFTVDGKRITFYCLHDIKRYLNECNDEDKGCPSDGLKSFIRNQIEIFKKGI